MTPRILDKVTMIDDRWVTIPFIRDEHGDRPAIPPSIIVRPAIPTQATKEKDNVRSSSR